MNMSYCMFENTVNDMRQCISALEDADWNLEELKKDSNPHEIDAIDYFITLCTKVVENYENTNE